jgi:hypothetical protein
MISKDFIEFQNPEFNSIPNIPLYMDQLLEYLSTHLSPLTRNENDSIFTKTMINNYVKSSVIDSPVKKKYARTSIGDLILVYHLKQCFSIQDTSDMLDQLKKASENYYTDFTELYQNILANAPTESIDSYDRNALVFQMMSYAIEASIKKQMAEQLLDHLIGESNKIIEKKPKTNQGSE